MHRTLTIEKSLRSTETEYAFMPDVGVNVESVAAVAAETDEALRRDIVAREGQRHVEGPRVERKE